MRSLFCTIRGGHNAPPIELIKTHIWFNSAGAPGRRSGWRLVRCQGGRTLTPHAWAAMVREGETRPAHQS